MFFFVFCCKSRGFYISLNEAGITCGILCSYVANAIFETNWRCMFLPMLALCFSCVVALYFKFTYLNKSTRNYPGPSTSLSNQAKVPKTRFPLRNFLLALFVVFSTQASGQPNFVYYAKWSGLYWLKRQTVWNFSLGQILSGFGE